MAPRGDRAALTALRHAVRARARARVGTLESCGSVGEGTLKLQIRSASSSATSTGHGNHNVPPRRPSRRPLPMTEGSDVKSGGLSSQSYPSEEKHPGAVHVKIQPRPQTLAESGQILEILRQFGDVEMYRHLRYLPDAPAHNSVVAIFRSPEAAESAIAASPIQFTLGGDIEGFEGAWEDVEKRIETMATGLGRTMQSAAEPPADLILNSSEIDEEDSHLALRDDTAPAWPDDGDPDFMTELDTAQSLVAPGDPEIFPTSGDGAAIQPPWEVMIASSETQSGPVKVQSSSGVRSPFTEPAQDSSYSTESTPSLDLRSDPSNPIALPRLPDKPPVITEAPAYRYSGLSSHARRQPALRPPTYDNDPEAHPPARPATLDIQSSGLAHRFFNLRQPYFGGFQARDTVYPGEGVLGDLPPGLHGLINTDPSKGEVAARQREKGEKVRRHDDLLAGMSLRQVWSEAQKARYRRTRRGESEMGWMETVAKL